MTPVVLQLLDTLETSLMLSLVTVGLYISFRILRFPDLTAEGGYGLSALFGSLAALYFQSPWIGLLVGGATGALAGVTTACLANVVRLPTVLASFLTMKMCLSFGVLVAGKPHQPLGDLWIYSPLESFFGHPLLAGLVGISLFLGLFFVALLVLMHSGFGLLLRVRGENPNLCSELGHSLLRWDIFGLAIANGIVGIGAVFFSQRAGYANVNMGLGVAIGALAAIMIAEAIFPNKRLSLALFACIVGTFFLQLVRLLALNIGLPSEGLDLVTSALVIGFVWVSSVRKKDKRSLLEQFRM